MVSAVDASGLLFTLLGAGIGITRLDSADVSQSGTTSPQTRLIIYVCLGSRGLKHIKGNCFPLLRASAKLGICFQ